MYEDEIFMFLWSLRVLFLCLGLKCSCLCRNKVQYGSQSVLWISWDLLCDIWYRISESKKKKRKIRCSALRSCSCSLSFLPLSIWRGRSEVSNWWTSCSWVKRQLAFFLCPPNTKCVYCKKVRSHVWCLGMPEVLEVSKETAIWFSPDLLYELIIF